MGYQLEVFAKYTIVDCSEGIVDLIVRKLSLDGRIGEMANNSACDYCRIYVDKKVPEFLSG